MIAGFVCPREEARFAGMAVAPAEKIAQQRGLTVAGRIAAYAAAVSLGPALYVMTAFVTAAAKHAQHALPIAPAARVTATAVHLSIFWCRGAAAR